MAWEPGPKAWLEVGGVITGALGWAYADIEPTPDHCGHWTVGTLVADPGDHDEPVAHDTRAIWVTEIYDPCGESAEMNGDGTVDAVDFALYLDHFAKETPQADLNGDKTVDTVDYLLYSAAYAKR